MITPSHNPPQSGGYKYNPTNGGPADTHVTKWIEAKANELLANKLAGVKRISHEQALKADTTHRHDYLNSYVADLINVIDIDAIRERQPAPGCRPIGWSRGALLVGDCRALPPEPGRGEYRSRPDLPLHDASTGTARSAWTRLRATPCKV